MKDKYNLTREQNVFVARRNIVDYIWKSANLEGIDVTYPETQVIYDGGIVNGLSVNKIITINNLKYAWNYILGNKDIKYDHDTLCHIHKLVADKLVLDQELGKIRTTPVNISGTQWKPQIPIQSKIDEELEMLLNQPDKTKTEIAIEIMLSVMRRQMFIDGNKRVAMLFANKIMIDNGCGIITIGKNYQKTFFDKLIKYYESNNILDLKNWIYKNCIDGIQFNNDKQYTLNFQDSNTYFKKDVTEIDKLNIIKDKLKQSAKNIETNLEILENEIDIYIKLKEKYNNLLNKEKVKIKR